MAPIRAPTLENDPLAPIHPFTKQSVPSMHQELFTRSLLRSFSPVLCVCLIKGFLPSITFLCVCHFFLLCLFLSFSSHTFSWACGSLREPWKFFSFCAFTCMSNNSLISQPNLCQHFSNVCSTCHSIFSLK